MPFGLELGAKEVLVAKEEKGFGLHVHGQNPVVIRNIDENGPAYRSGARKGDQIIKVNGEFVGDSSHEKVVRLIKDQTFIRLLVIPCSKSEPIMSSGQRLVAFKTFGELGDTDQKVEQKNPDGSESIGRGRMETDRTRKQIASVISEESSDFFQSQVLDDSVRLNTACSREYNSYSSASDDSEEPDIQMSSFMSGDPNFNREAVPSTSMDRAFLTLEKYLLDYNLLKTHRPAMLVFLHSLLSTKNARTYKLLNLVFYDWLSDVWKAKRSAGTSLRIVKQNGFALYSTFLHPDGQLNLIESMSSAHRQQVASEGLPENFNSVLLDDAHTLIQKATGMFSISQDMHVEKMVHLLHSIQKALLPELQKLASTVYSEIEKKRRDGFLADMLPGIDNLRDEMDAERQNTFLEKSSRLIMRHIDYIASSAFGGKVEAVCLASVCYLYLGLSEKGLKSELCVKFFTDPLRASSGLTAFLGAERKGNHYMNLTNFELLRGCSACGKVLLGPEPQGYQCAVSDCIVVCHHQCVDQIKPIACSKLGLLKSAIKETTSESCEVEIPDASKAYQQKGVIANDGDCTQRASKFEPQNYLTEAQKLSTNESVKYNHQSSKNAQFEQNQQVGDFYQHGEKTAVLRCSSQYSACGSSDGPESNKGLINSCASDKEGEPNSDTQRETAATVNEDSNSDILDLPGDFEAYIEQPNIRDKLKNLSERFKSYQLALHEIVYSTRSHIRHLTVLQNVFVNTWPLQHTQIMHQLGLQFVAQCIVLYQSLLNCLQSSNQNESEQTGFMNSFGQRLLKWYSRDNLDTFKRLSLSFGFAKTHSKRKNSAVCEDDIIIRLINLRRECLDFDEFFRKAESHPLMNKLRFSDLYSVNIQFTMRLVTLLGEAVKKARKTSDKSAAIDAEDLEKCYYHARSVSEYSNTIGAKLKELSRQLVLSKSFIQFWEKSWLPAKNIALIKSQICHLHTIRLWMTREVSMRDFENYRLRLLVFTEFLLVVSESEDPKGSIKYQLLRHLGQSASVNLGDQNQPLQQPLKLVACPSIIPINNIVHQFLVDTENRRKQELLTSAKSRPENYSFNIIIEQSVDTSGEQKPILCSFILNQEKPRSQFFTDELELTGSDFIECIAKLSKSQKNKINRHQSLAASVGDIGNRDRSPTSDHKRANSHVGTTRVKIFHENILSTVSPTVAEEAELNLTGEQLCQSVAQHQTKTADNLELIDSTDNERLLNLTKDLRNNLSTVASLIDLQSVDKDEIKAIFDHGAPTIQQILVLLTNLMHETQSVTIDVAEAVLSKDKPVPPERLRKICDTAQQTAKSIRQGIEGMQTESSTTDPNDADN